MACGLGFDWREWKDLEDRELSFEKNARVRGFVDGFACGLGGWKHVNFCVGDLVKVMWRMGTDDGR